MNMDNRSGPDMCTYPNQYVKDGAHTEVTLGALVHFSQEKVLLPLRRSDRDNEAQTRSRGKPEIKALMILVNTTIILTASSCAWVMRQYKESSNHMHLTQGDSHFQFPLILRLDILEHAKVLLPDSMADPSPHIFVAAVLLYSANISVLYCLHRDEKHLDTWLVLGVCTAFMGGLLSKTDISRVLVEFLPITVLISLLMSVAYHRCLSPGCRRGWARGEGWSWPSLRLITCPVSAGN
ncbi:hypothetical protein GGR51DRAFT_497215 [Nemania sp. FL0031]|nr:hypothetical protein GGR51DRAFT_497215 [Nemania sp. FL0031]